MSSHQRKKKAHHRCERGRDHIHPAVQANRLTQQVRHQPSHGIPHTPQLHITVAVSPGERLSLEREVQMVKTALLYADAVSLCSPGISTVLATRDPQRMTDQERSRLLLQVAPLLGFPRDKLDTLGVLLAFGKNRTLRHSEVGMTLAEFQREIDRTWQQLAEKSDELIQQYGVDQLLPVIRAGLVTIQPLPVTMLDLITAAADPSLGRQNTEEATKRYWDIVSQAIQIGDTHLLLDEFTSELVQLAVRDGVLQPTTVQTARHTHVGLSAQVLQRLPTFDHATMEEVAHVRQELEQPLGRFRAAMIEYAGTMHSAQWDADFPLEADLIFRHHVVPALEDLEEEMRANGFVRQLFAKAAQSKVIVPATSLSVLLSHLGNLGDLAHLAFAGAVGGGVAEVVRLVADVQQARGTKQRELEQNHLYFAYRANQLLSH